jgi:hypothetical protein
VRSLPVERHPAPQDPWTVHGAPVRPARVGDSSAERIAAGTAARTPLSAAAWRARLGRQPIVTSDGRTIGYEFP